MVENPHEALCPSCQATICLRCAAFEVKTSPDGLDGCEDCERFLKRTQRAWRKHMEQHHGQPAADAARDGEG